MEEINLRSVGKLQPHPDIPDEWLISESVSVRMFDSKELKFVLNVDLENDTSFLSEADQAIQNLLEKGNDDKFSITNFVYKNYREIQNYYDTQFWEQPALKLSNKDEIWNYVNAYEIYVCRNSIEDKNIYLLVHCSCEWEVEHGLQLVFKNGAELTRVSGIDCSPV